MQRSLASHVSPSAAPLEPLPDLHRTYTEWKNHGGPVEDNKLFIRQGLGRSDHRSKAGGFRYVGRVDADGAMPMLRRPLPSGEHALDQTLKRKLKRSPSTTV